MTRRCWRDVLAAMLSVAAGCADSISGTTRHSDAALVADAASDAVDARVSDDRLASFEAGVPNINCPLGYSYWYEDGGVHLERVLLCSEWENPGAVCCLSTHALPFLEYPVEASWPVRCVPGLLCREGGVVGRPPW